MSHRVPFRRGGVLVAIGVGVLAVVAAIVVSKTWSVSAQAGTFNISKSANATVVQPGDEITYSIIFTNTGGVATTAVMTDIIPYGVTYVTGSATASTGTPVYNLSPARINWSGTVNPGQQIVVTFRVLVVEPGTLGPFPLVNQAQVNGVWSIPVTVYSVRAPILSISKTASAVNVQPGDVVTYTIVFTNSGTLGSMPTMQDVIPFGVTYVTGSATASRGTAVYNTGPARVNWTDTLNPGDVVTVTFAVQVVEPSTAGPLPIPNQACIDGVCSTVTIYSSRAGAFTYLPVVMRNYEARPPWPWIRP